MGNNSQFQSEMSDLSPEYDDSDKVIRKSLVKDIAIYLFNSKMKNGGRTPHGELNKHLDRVKDVCPTITRNMINKDMQLNWTSLMYEDECVVVSNEDNDTNDDFSKDRGGRPVGSTVVFKHENELRRVKVHNDISIKYTVEKRSLPRGTRLPRGCLNEITEGVTFECGLDSSGVCIVTIRKRKEKIDPII